ncbi:MAG: PqqD family protein [Candidatus Omnitrophica bacterium]|nr:PqqD family protein [Candidatus Omnitrophota bacterium]
MDTLYEKNPDVIFRKIAGEYLLMPIKQKAVDLRSIYTLNETASCIWQLLDGKTTIGDIQKALCEQFDITSEQALWDIQEFVSQLEALGFIHRISR